jgi:hypothetical protein
LGILGLEIAGIDYDVSFKYGLYDDVFETTPPTFLVPFFPSMWVNFQGFSLAASGAVSSALKAEDLFLVGDGVNNSPGFFIPYGFCDASIAIPCPPFGGI